MYSDALDEQTFNEDDEEAYAQMQQDDEEAQYDRLTLYDSPVKPVAVQSSKNTSKGKQKQVIELDSEDDDEIVENGFDNYDEINDGFNADNRQENQELDSILEEIKSVEVQIKELQDLRVELRRRATAIKAKANKLKAGSSKLAAIAPVVGSVDYHHSDFKWSTALKAKIEEVWKVSCLRSSMQIADFRSIKSFRTGQEGVCNAVLAGRDVVVIMPTGAGKSLTYQAPALMSKGTTIVVSPLLALSSDQVFHLSEVGVHAVMLSSATSKSDANDIMRQLSHGPDSADQEIKLLYLTPEKIAKSKMLVNALQKCYDDGRLARIVIDEAHCASALGHDFRPDYRKLNVFKTLFPKTRIIALTATCPPAVLQDILKILQLEKTTPGDQASAGKRTVLFTSALYRPNLHYHVFPRPNNAKEALAAMAKWIKENHEGELGIVYCLSQKDTQTIAEGLRTEEIKTAIYHAGLEDREKERVHSSGAKGRSR